MTIAHRSLIAITLAAALAGCGKDSEPTVPFPEVPEPLVPAPAEEITVSIGDSLITGTKESMIITSNTEDDKIGYVESFKGIKFADAKRFEHSKTIELSDLNDSEGTIDATEFGFVCPQLKESALNLEQSEDCLNLNIWRPLGSHLDEELPVYVFIHGGDFEYGSGSEPLIHGDTVVAQGASEGNPFIYVTFNYRLGLLGSVYVDSTEGGNFGIGDQKRALEWVNKNIASFGGNPDNVTLMGQGSGAMSVGILQQTDVGDDTAINNSHFQRAIMQSPLLGFEYQSYKTAKVTAEKIDITELGQPEEFQNILNIQKDLVSVPSVLVDWLSKSALPTIKETCGSGLFNPCRIFVDLIPDVESDMTPMASFMPFAPYIEDKNNEQNIGQHLNSQPANNNFVVDTVIGVNEKDANTFTALPSLTYFIAPLLNSDLFNDEELSIEKIKKEFVELLENEEFVGKLASIETPEDLAKFHYSTELDLLSIINSILEFIGFDTEYVPDSAYGFIAHLMFGLENFTPTDELTRYTDYKAMTEDNLDKSLGNMNRFNTLVNDMLYSAPARNIASRDSGNSSTFYSFSFKPSFNVWTHDSYYDDEGKLKLDITGLIKTISCLSGACNGSELPFVFNKPYKLDGQEVHPLSKDKALMNDMSRLWFSDELFNHQYISEVDNTIVISEDGEIDFEVVDWDRTFNESEDVDLAPGRLTGLDNNGLTLHYIN